MSAASGISIAMPTCLATAKSVSHRMRGGSWIGSPSRLTSEAVSDGVVSKPTARSFGIGAPTKSNTLVPSRMPTTTQRSGRTPARGTNGASSSSSPRPGTAARRRASARHDWLAWSPAPPMPRGWRRGRRRACARRSGAPRRWWRRHRRASTVGRPRARCGVSRGSWVDVEIASGHTRTRSRDPASSLASTPTGKRPST